MVTRYSHRGMIARVGDAKFLTAHQLAHLLRSSYFKAGWTVVNQGTELEYVVLGYVGKLPVVLTCDPSEYVDFLNEYQRKEIKDE